MVWPWQAAWWPAGDSMNHLVMVQRTPPKNAKIESVAIVFQNEHRKNISTLLGTEISPTKGCVSSPESISEESKSPCAAHGSLHQAREGL